MRTQNSRLGKSVLQVSKQSIGQVLDQNLMDAITGRNKSRLACLKLVINSKFETFIILCILTTSVCLAIESPLRDPEGMLMRILLYMDYAFTAVFFVEAVLKIYAYGFIFNGDYSYIRNLVNIIDFIIVACSLLTVLSLFDLSFFKVVRLLKILRPLRVVSRNEGLKLSIISLVSALPNIFTVCVVGFVFFMIFGIIGVNYFKGGFFACEELILVNKVQEKWECYSMGGTWRNYYVNFDNVFSSMFALISIASRAGWVEVMQRATETTKIDFSPKRDSSPNYVILFIVFIIIASFFIMNLFVGVIISTFNREKEKEGGNVLLTKVQKKWLNQKLLMIQSTPKVQIKIPSGIRFKFYKLHNKIWFEYGIYASILLNTLALTIVWYDQDPTISLITDILNYFFAGVFTIEAIVKIIALDKRYFVDPWNVFDFVIVIGTMITITLSQLLDLEVGPQATLLRAFRIGRMFKIFKRNKSLKIIFQTFIATLPALANVGSLMLLFIYMYSILGVQLFATIKLSDPLNDIVNFKTVGFSMLTLFRIATGEKWNEIVYALSKEKSPEFKCLDDPSYQDFIYSGHQTVGCGVSWAAIFFLSYILVIMLIFLNLFVAVIL